MMLEDAEVDLARGGAVAEEVADDEAGKHHPLLEVKRAQVLVELLVVKWVDDLNRRCWRC